MVTCFLEISVSYELYFYLIQFFCTTVFKTWPNTSIGFLGNDNKESIFSYSRDSNGFSYESNQHCFWRRPKCITQDTQSTRVLWVLFKCKCCDIWTIHELWKLFSNSHWKKTGKKHKVVLRCGLLNPRAFSVAAPRLWNELPHTIKLSPSLDIFKSSLKTFLFIQAYV
jgi:hypothetical protein